MPAKLAVRDVCPDAPKHLLPPMSVFLVKGWSRSLAAIACMLHAFEVEDALKAGTT